MRSHEPQTDQAQGTGGLGGTPAEPSGEAAVSAEGPRRPWAWAIPAGLVAGLVAWAIGEASLETFQLTAEELASGDVTNLGREGSLYLEGLRRVTTRNAALHYGILGAAVGGALGLAGGLSRRSVSGGGVGGGIGLVVGGAVGALMSLALVPVFLNTYDPARPSLFLPLLVHGGIWVLIGAAGGLALGLGRRDGRARIAGIALGGAIGALLGTVAYEVFYAVAFPLARSETPLPSRPTIRLIAHLIIALAIALGASWNVRAGRRPEVRPAE